MHRKRVVFAGGGTGGHLFPALALARALPFLEAVFLVPHDRGDRERMNGQFQCVRFVNPRFDRAPWFYPLRLALAVRRARRILQELEATAVVGLGGYASVPAALAARSLGLPLYLMECNAVPGKATRLLARCAAGIGLGSESARERLSRRPRCRVTGTPLRAGLRVLSDARDFGLDSRRRTLLVLGGSQGAQGLNERVTRGLRACSDLDFQVLHCAGERDLQRTRRAYAALGRPARVLSFLADIGRGYGVADFVLSRAGASTVAECLALGLPAVYVPYPWHRDRQQLVNAQRAERAGAARIVAESELDPAALRTIVTDLLLDDGRRSRMASAARRLGQPGAAKAMAAHLLESFGEALAEPTCLAELGG